jgi:hypothetical protein
MEEFLRRMIRSETGTYLNTSCSIERLGEQVDEGFTPAPQWSIVAQDVSCRVIKAGTQSSSTAKDVLGQTAIEERYRLIVPHTTELGVKDRVTVSGVIYYVVQLELELTDKAFRSAIIQQMAGANG